MMNAIMPSHKSRRGITFEDFSYTAPSPRKTKHASMNSRQPHMSLTRRDGGRDRRGSLMEHYEQHGDRNCEDYVFDPRFVYAWGVRPYQPREMEYEPPGYSRSQRGDGNRCCPRRNSHAQATGPAGLPPRCMFPEDGLEPRTHFRTESHTKSGIAFNTAMTGLFRQLKKSHEYFGSFSKEYTKDIAAIKSYAGTDVLNMLWVSKVRGSDKGRADSGSGQNQNVKDDEPPSVKFDDNKKKIKNALAAAIASNIRSLPPSRANKVLQSDAVSLQQKIKLFNGRIIDLLETAKDGKEVCESLRKELENLKKLVDPDANKELYAVMTGKESTGTSCVQPQSEDEGGNNDDDQGDRDEEQQHWN